MTQAIFREKCVDPVLRVIIIIIVSISLPSYRFQWVCKCLFHFTVFIEVLVVVCFL